MGATLPEPPPSNVMQMALEVWPQVYGFARSLVNDSASAEDYCQEAFVRLLERAETVDASRAILPLLLTIVRNLVFSDRRRDKIVAIEPLTTGIEREMRDLPDPAAEDPVGQLLRSESREMLEQALGTLPRSWREALYLRDGLAFSYREIGEVMGASTDTIRTLLYRARTRLTELLSRRGREA